jgi:hypothetical protein
MDSIQKTNPGTITPRTIMCNPAIEQEDAKITLKNETTKKVVFFIDCNLAPYFPKFPFEMNIREHHLAPEGEKTKEPPSHIFRLTVLIEGSSSSKYDLIVCETILQGNVRVTILPNYTAIRKDMTLQEIYSEIEDRYKPQLKDRLCGKESKIVVIPTE